MTTELSLSPLEETRSRFIEAAGNTTQSFGLGRVIGQTYALLFLSPKPLCLDDIARELGVSKASVSTTVRQLENWAAVRQVWIKGDRRDYYEAEADFGVILRGGVLTRLRRKLETGGTQLERAHRVLEEALQGSDEREKEEIAIIADRLRRAKEFHGKINALLSDPLLDHLL